VAIRYRTVKLTHGRTSAGIDSKPETEIEVLWETETAVPAGIDRNRPEAAIGSTPADVNRPEPAIAAPEVTEAGAEIV